MSTPVVSGRTVLVTGGAGFIGSHLVDALVAENEVRVLDDFSTGRRENLNGEATVIQGDVADSTTLDEALAGVDTVFHESAIVDVERSVASPRECHAVNVGGTLSVLQGARKADARVVLASSAAVYGQPDAVPLAEDAPQEPTSPYGLDKLTAEHYCRLFDELYGLETVALRYFNVYGPRQTGGDYSGVLEAFTSQCRAGEPMTVHGDGEQTRDFVHVRDVVRANLRAATTDRTGEAFNVGTGESVSIKTLAEVVREATGADSAVVHTDARSGDVEASRADLSKSRRTLGFEPTVPLREGITRLVDRD